MNSERKWEDMDSDILVKTFNTLDTLELTSGIGQVCSSWRMACASPLLWRTLDLSTMKSNFIKTPVEPYVYVHSSSDKTLTRLLKIALNLSKGSIVSVILHLNLYITDEQLTYISKRCPHLKKLVFPAWNRIKRTSICGAIRSWKELESLTMPSIANPPYLIKEIANNCTNFSELKIMGPFDTLFATTLVMHLPKLKVLSLRCSPLLKDALITILDGLQSLQVLNICHCLLIEIPPALGSRRVMEKIDDTIHRKASRLNQFLTCTEESCVTCQRTKDDEGIMRWHRYEEGFWKEDEVLSLSQY